MERPAPGYVVINARPERPLEAHPGQFAMLRVPGRSEAVFHRPMSILASGETLAFLVRVVGPGTRALARLGAGDALEMVAPLGNWLTVPEHGGREILCGGGVGASPLLFHARASSAAGIRPTMIYGGRTRADLVLADEMQDVADLVCVTEDGSAGLEGLATDPLAEALGQGHVGRVIACGPVPMMAAAAGLARGAGASCLVCLEAMMACGFGACLGCAVPATAGGYLYVCSDGPVLDATRIDWEALRQAQGRG
jgi:dihydroorotate dehydrogenase electron transfer subunit